MPEEYWDEIRGIGKLYVEEELVVGIEPVLLVCIDDKNNRYLVMTYDSYNGIYIYRKIESDELLDMLENRNTMERTFRLGKRIYKTFIEENSNILGVEEYDSQTFSGSMLPDVGEYYEIHSEYIQKYIDKLRGCKINQQEFEKFDCEIIVTTVKIGKDIDYCALNYNRQFCKTVTEKDIWDKNYCFEEKINFAA